VPSPDGDHDAVRHEGEGIPVAFNLFGSAPREGGKAFPAAAVKDMPFGPLGRSHRLWKVEQLADDLTGHRSLAHAPHRVVAGLAKPMRAVESVVHCRVPFPGRTVPTPYF